LPLFITVIELELIISVNEQLLSRKNSVLNTLEKQLSSALKLNLVYCCL